MRSAACTQPHMDSAELGSWLRLLGCPGVGRRTARRLLSRLGSPGAVATADGQLLVELVGEDVATALQSPMPEVEELLARTQQWLSGSAARAVVAIGDPTYSPLLLETADPPLLLYAQGRLDLLHATSVAVVGSRRPTPQGIDTARQIARELSERCWTVVSGLAAGIDGAAHCGGLEGEAGTIAVVGTGLDQVYPRRHVELARRIEAGGLMLSEYPIATPPLASNFPQRNRIIAGLARGTLVVEAAVRSGSLITARLAAEEGREVLAVPGSIRAEQSRGCHALIRDGAALVESVDDILAAVAPRTRPSGPDPGAPGTVECDPPRGPARSSAATRQDSTAGDPTTEADPILRALGYDPVDLDTLMARSGHPAANINARLIELEFEGRVARLPGGRYQRRGTG